MRKSQERNKQSPLIKFLNVLTVLVLLAAILSISKLVRELRYAFNREPYSNMEYNLQDENYGDMVREYYNRGYDVAPFATLHEEEYHVAEYADAGFRLLFYENTGDQEQAERMKIRMQAAREGCGALSVSADDLDDILEKITVYPSEDAS